jgi:putative transcriptional regulator
MSSITLRIRHHRNRHGLSQEELAKRLGVSRQALIAIEQGASRPSLPVVLAIMRVFDLPFHELFEREGIRLHSKVRDELSNSRDMISTDSETHPIPFNLSETEKEYCLEADLAGVKEEDVRIDLGFSHVAIYAVRRRMSEGNILAELIPIGSLLRIVALPEPINPDHSEAQFRDGCLKLILPKNSAPIRTIQFNKKEKNGSK